ncbi:MAG: DUF4157 domain-containing protein [Pyrinomonadaceae bacterium]
MMQRFRQKSAPGKQRGFSHVTRSTAAASAPVHHTHPIQYLQRTIGNQAVARMLRSSVDTSTARSNGFAFASDAVHAAAERGTNDSGVRLPHYDAIQRSFGRHDVSSIRAHVGAEAAAASHSIGASAYATGDAVVFGGAPDLRTAAHEAAHVVQQRSGVNLPGGIGQQGDSYEQHADAVAARVVQGHSAEGLLDQHSGSTTGARSVQRFAFVKEKQIEKSEKDFTKIMKNWVSDSVVRNYTDVAEFKDHTEKKTDYLGNLKDGTWMRFSPTGINLLGENHTKVTLQQVVPAIGTTNFIRERFSSDVLTAGSELEKAYERENIEEFKKMGIEKEKDKAKFGAESLFPKIGFGLTEALPYLEGREPMSDLDKTGYLGKPVQRYLKLAWAHSKDNKVTVDKKLKAKEAVPPKMEALATVHGSVAGKLDKFITSLSVDGFLGDELGKKKNAALLAPLAEFAKAFTDAMVELAATEKSSRLSAAERKRLSSAKSISEADKKKLFSEWRDFLFEDNVKAATARGVRYAGMGQAHLDHLVAVGLTKDQHPFEMDGKDITAFRDLTDKLKKAAKK